MTNRNNKEMQRRKNIAQKYPHAPHCPVLDQVGFDCDCGATERRRSMSVVDNTESSSEAREVVTEVEVGRLQSACVRRFSELRGDYSRAWPEPVEILERLLAERKTMQAALVRELGEPENVTPLLQLTRENAELHAQLAAMTERTEQAEKELARKGSLLSDWIAAAQSGVNFGRMQQEPRPSRLREAIAQALENETELMAIRFDLPLVTAERDAERVRLARASRRLDGLRALHIEGPEETCGQPECLTCGALTCEYGEPLHFDKDGCPACTVDEVMRAFADVRLEKKERESVHIEVEFNGWAEKEMAVYEFKRSG